jgi:acylpyruvate hydrolase
MRLATIRTDDGPRLHVRGIDGYVDLAAVGEPRPSTLDGHLASDERTRDLARRFADTPGRAVGEADFGPAVPSLRRILCVGVNYSEHTAETGRSVPDWPESFTRSEDSVIGPYDDLVRPALTNGLDYEGELGILIGTGGRYIRAAGAMSTIAGFTVLNDATTRDR